MPRRDLRLRTNVDDLLDDGIENNSDLIGADFSSDPVNDHDPAAVQIREKTVARIRAEEAQAGQLFRQKSISYLGTLIGLAFAISGLLLVVRPVDMRVEHTRIKYLPTVIERVTVTRSRLYGSALLVFGFVLLGYSLHRPRK